MPPHLIEWYCQSDANSSPPGEPARADFGNVGDVLDPAAGRINLCYRGLIIGHFGVEGGEIEDQLVVEPLALKAKLDAAPAPAPLSAKPRPAALSG